MIRSHQPSPSVRAPVRWAGRRGGSGTLDRGHTLGQGSSSSLAPLPLIRLCCHSFWIPYKTGQWLALPSRQTDRPPNSQPALQTDRQTDRQTASQLFTQPASQPTRHAASQTTGYLKPHHRHQSVMLGTHYYHFSHLENLRDHTHLMKYSDTFKFFGRLVCRRKRFCHHSTTH